MSNRVKIRIIFTTFLVILVSSLLSGCAKRDLPSGDIYAVRIASPDDGDTLNTPRPYLDWYTYPNANGYRILIWRDDSLVWDHIEFNSSVKVLIPLRDGKYRWCVGVRVGSGDFEHWSDTLTFVVNQQPFEIRAWATTPGVARDVAPAGNILYVADGQAGMTIISVQGDSLEFLRNIDWPEQYEAQGIYADTIASLVAVADYRGVPPIYFFDITDRENPSSGISGVWARLCGDVTGFWMRDTFFIAAADRDDGCYIYDYTGENYVNQRGSPFATPGFCTGVAAKDTIVAVCCEDAGVILLDVSDPDNKTQIGWCDTPGQATRAIFWNNYLFVADGLAGLGVIDVSNPSSPEYIYQSDLQVGEAQDLAIAVIDDVPYLALATGSEGVLFYDISTPELPGLVGQIETMYAYGVASYNQNFYIADRDWGIILVTHQ